MCLYAKVTKLLDDLWEHIEKQDKRIEEKDKRIERLLSVLENRTNHYSKHVKT